MGKLLGPEFLAGLDKNPEYTRAGVDRLYCTRNSFPDIAFRIYINSYEKLAICTWVGTKYCILPTLSQRVLYLKKIVIIIRFNIHG